MPGGGSSRDYGTTLKKVGWLVIGKQGLEHSHSESEL